jgi:lipoate-protein ligase A
MTIKFINGNCTDPYRNLAFEELLLDAVQPNEYLLYLWQNEHTIVIGRNQNAYAECRVDEFIADGGKLARRLSGGGAVYHDLGNLNFTLLAHNNIFDRQKHYEIILKTLLRIGINAEFNGRNDLLVDGRKFSGNAFYDNGNVSYQHGTILVNCNIANMQRYLTPDASKLARNTVQSVGSRVTNLSQIQDGISVEAIRTELIKTVGAVPFLDVLDNRQIETKADLYRSRQWLFGE